MCLLISFREKCELFSGKCSEISKFRNFYIGDYVPSYIFS